MIDVKALRLRLGLTQQQLADRLGVDQATVSRLETGRTQPSGPIRRLLASMALEPSATPPADDPPAAAGKAA